MHTKKSILLFFILPSLVLIFSAQAYAQTFSPDLNTFIKVKANIIALLDAKIIDGTGGPVKNHQNLLIENGRIVKIEDKGDFKIPSNATVINCAGKTLIPGLVMMHEHLFYGELAGNFYLGQAMPISFPQLYLAGGVTTMRTAGSTEPQTDLNILNWIREGKMLGPDIDVTGPYIERKGLPIPEMLFIKNTKEAVKEVAYWADMGCTSFKAYMNITRADLQAVLKEAHGRGLKVTGHLGSITYREAATLGIDNLEHGFMASTDFVRGKKEDINPSSGQRRSLMDLDENSNAMKDLMAYLIKKNVTLTSTLTVFEPFTGRELFPGAADSAVAMQVRIEVEKDYNAMVDSDSAYAALFKKEMFWEKQFVAMGGRLMAGIDPTGYGRVIPGYANRHTLELLVEAGFTFSQAVNICTLNGAKFLEKDKTIGSIVVGKQADLVLIDGDPEKDIKAVRNTETVFKNGIGFDSKKIFDAVKGMVGLY